MRPGKRSGAPRGDGAPGSQAVTTPAGAADFTPPERQSERTLFDEPEETSPRSETSRRREIFAPARRSDELEAARHDRDQGAETALDAAHSWSRMAAERAILRRAASGQAFTSDDVHEDVGSPLACSPNVMGALILAAARAGVIVKVGYTQSARRSGRGRAIAVWRGAS